MADDPKKSTHRSDPASVVNISIRGKQRVEFYHHALERMKSRGMTEQEVLTTLGDPDEVKDSSQPNRKEAYRNFGSLNTAKVIFEELEDHLRVISVMWQKRRLTGK